MARAQLQAEMQRRQAATNAAIDLERMRAQMQQQATKDALVLELKEFKHQILERRMLEAKLGAQLDKATMLQQLRELQREMATTKASVSSLRMPILAPSAASLPHSTPTAVHEAQAQLLAAQLQLQQALGVSTPNPQPSTAGPNRKCASYSPPGIWQTPFMIICDEL